MFTFNGSKQIIDYIRDASIILPGTENENEDEHWQKLFATVVSLKQPTKRSIEKSNRRKGKNPINNANSLGLDREYLSKLESNLKPIKGLEKEG